MTVSFFHHREQSRSDRNAGNWTYHDTIGHWLAAVAFVVAIVFVLLSAKVAGG